MFCAFIGKALKDTISRDHVSPGSGEALVKLGGKIDQCLTANSLSNVFDVLEQILIILAKL